MEKKLKTNKYTGLNSKAKLPEWIYMQANLYKGKHDEFLDTCCFATAAAIRTLFGDETSWSYAEKPSGNIYQVDFQDEHILTIEGDKVYQSYVWKHPVIETDYHEETDYWQHISHDPLSYKGIKPKFIILK